MFINAVLVILIVTTLIWRVARDDISSTTFSQPCGSELLVCINFTHTHSLCSFANSFTKVRPVWHRELTFYVLAVAETVVSSSQGHPLVSTCFTYCWEQTIQRSYLPFLGLIGDNGTTYPRPRHPPPEHS